MRNAPSGFTLLEVMIVIALMSIVFSLAVPSLMDARSNQQVDSVQRSLLSAMNSARSMAISQGQSISLCASSDGQHCDGVWSGWLVFQGAVPASNVPVLGLSQGSTEQIPVSASGDRATWRATGAALDSLTLSLCPPEAQQRRQVTLSLIGRPRGSLDLDGDRVHEIPSGACP